MGTKYSSVTVTGYNASPPADDGTQVASNQVTWAKHKGKIGDPLKTAIEAINTALVTDLNYAVRQVTASGTINVTDHKKTVVIGSTVTAGITMTLPDAATATSNYIVNVNNQSNVACTVSRVTVSNTINGETANVTLMPLETISFIVNADQNGYLAWSSGDPENPCFLAYNSAQDLNQTGNGAVVTIDFDTEVVDVGSNFASDTFTAPNTGRYLLSANVNVINLTTAMNDFILNIVTSNRTYSVQNLINVETAGDTESLVLTVIADMDAGDTAAVTVVVDGGAGDTAAIQGSSALITSFSGARIA